MRKLEEMEHPDSCLNKAEHDEMLFVIRAHDPASTAALLAWIQERVRIGKNKFSDQQIQDTLGCIEIMELQRQEGY